MKQIVKDGDTVIVHYVGRLSDGNVFDSSLDREPLQFNVGAGQVIKGFENGILGMECGEKKTISISPEEAYGDYDNTLVIDIPKTDIPEHIIPEIGMQLQLANENGEEFFVIISDIQDKSIKLDANHPLAGKELIFDLELVEII